MHMKVDWKITKSRTERYGGKRWCLYTLMLYFNDLEKCNMKSMTEVVVFKNAVRRCQRREQHSLT